MPKWARGGGPTYPADRPENDLDQVCIESPTGLCRKPASRFPIGGNRVEHLRTITDKVSGHTTDVRDGFRWLSTSTSTAPSTSRPPDSSIRPTVNGPSLAQPAGVLLPLALRPHKMSANSASLVCRVSMSHKEPAGSGCVSHLAGVLGRDC